MLSPDSVINRNKDWGFISSPVTSLYPQSKVKKISSGNEFQLLSVVVLYVFFFWNLLLFLCRLNLTRPGGSLLCYFTCLSAHLLTMHLLQFGHEFSVSHVGRHLVCEMLSVSCFFLVTWFPSAPEFLPPASIISSLKPCKLSPEQRLLTRWTKLDSLSSHLLAAPHLPLFLQTQTVY